MAARNVAWDNAMSIERKLAELGIALPEPAAPVAAYVPVVVHGGLAHVSGQLPFIDGQLVTGRLGEDVALEQGTATRLLLRGHSEDWYKPSAETFSVDAREVLAAFGLKK